MQESEDLNPPERELARALQSLQLVPLQTSPRWIWYQAGLGAGRRRSNGWRAIAATTTLAAALLFVWGRHTAPPEERLVYVGRESTPAVAVVAPTDAVSTTSLSAEYLRLCDEAIQDGLDRSSREHFGSNPSQYVPPSHRQGLDPNSTLPGFDSILNVGDGI